MALRTKKTDLPKRFSIGQLVDVMQRRPGVDLFRRRARVASVTNRMVKLPEGSSWRATDGYEWGTADSARWFAPRIVPCTGFILCRQGLYVQLGTDGVVLNKFSAATSWNTRAEAETAVTTLGLKGEWTVFDSASGESSPISAKSDPSPVARPASMNETDWALYWSTASWLEKDVATETGLPEAECRRLWAEVERVRALETQQP